MSKRDTLMAQLRDRGWDALAVRDGVLETDLSGAEKLTLLALVSHCGGRATAGGPRGLSVRRIAELTSSNKDTPKRVLARLEHLGLIRIIRSDKPRIGQRFDLSALPAALLSALEGQSLSVPKGQSQAGVCPFARGGIVPSDAPRLSVAKGHKQDLKKDHEARRARTRDLNNSRREDPDKVSPTEIAGFRIGPPRCSGLAPIGGLLAAGGTR